MANAVCVLFMCMIMESVFQSEAKPLILLDSIDIIFMNKSFGQADITLGKLKNGAQAINVSLNIIRDVPEDVTFDLKIYKLDEDTKEYAQIYDLTKNLCTFAENEYRDLFGQYLEDGFLKNFLKSCPITKGHYYFVDGTVPNDDMPNMPLWTVKSTVKLMTDTYKLLDAVTYTHIEEGKLDDSNSK